MKARINASSTSIRRVSHRAVAGVAFGGPASVQPYAVPAPDCGCGFSISARNARRHRADGIPDRCRLRRALTKPSAEEVAKARGWWLDVLGGDEARRLAGMIWPEPFQPTRGGHKGATAGVTFPPRRTKAPL